MNEGAPVVVVGAGIAGLASAFYLRRAGCSVRVLEQGGPEMVGGRMATADHGGYLVEHCASILMCRYRHLLKLIADAGLSGQVVPAGDEIALVGEGEVRRVHTASYRSMLRAMARFSARDLLKLANDYRRLRSAISWDDLSAMAAHDGESVREYAVRRGLRKDTVELLLDPVSKAMSLGEDTQTSAIAPFMFVDIVLGGAGFFTSAQGVGFVPRGLARMLPIEYDARVTSVREHAEEVVVTWDRPGEAERTETAAACVIATPVPQALEIYQQLTPDQRRYLQEVEYVPDMHVSFGLDRATRERALLMLISRSGDPDIVAYSLPHNQAPQRVPGAGLVHVHFRADYAVRNWDQGEPELVDRVLEGCRRLGVLPELEGHTRMTHVERVRRALVLRRPGDYRAIARFAATLAKDDLVQFAGADYLAHSSTEGSVASALRAVGNISETLMHR